MMVVFRRDGQETHREEDLKMEAEIGAVCLQAKSAPRTASHHQQLKEGKAVLLRASRKHSLC